MAKASINSGGEVAPVHTRTTSDAVETQAACLVVDGTDSAIPADAANGLDVDVTRSALPTGASTEATLAAVLTELGSKLEPADLAALATAAKQDLAKTVLDNILLAVDGLEGKDFATQTTLASILAKIIAAPATEAKQDTLIAAVDGLEANTTGLATQATLASILTDLQAKADANEAQATAGNVAHDAADSGSPVKTGGRARTALPTAVAQDDRTDTITDKHGRTLVAYAPLDQRVNGLVNEADATADDVIAAPGANVAIVVTTILVTNAHQTVATKVEIRDDTTVKIRGQADVKGGGFNLHDPEGLFIATANKPITARCVTTGADVDIFVAGYKLPV